MEPLTGPLRPFCHGLLIVLWLASMPAIALGGDEAVPASSCRCMVWTGGALALGMAGGITLLDQAWYADFERGPLRAFNDGDEWLQMDKAGHVFSAYTLSTWGHALLDRCRPGDRKVLWYGAGSGLAFLTAVELLDGTSEAWGFSWWDMAANVAGTGLYIGQELAWGEQRVRLKMSARYTEYAALRPELLGEGPAERLLKDYNGMTIWLSVNPSSFRNGDDHLPWLNLALGYGAEGMITASPPQGPADLGGELMRQRRFLLSPDIDLSRIPTRSKAVRTILFVLNSIKVPAPALEITGQGRIRGHWIYF